MAASNIVDMEQDQEALLDDENVPSVHLAEKKIQRLKYENTLVLQWTKLVN